MAANLRDGLTVGDDDRAGLLEGRRSREPFALHRRLHPQSKSRLVGRHTDRRRRLRLQLAEQLHWAPDLGESGLAAGYEAISSITSSNGGSGDRSAVLPPYTEWESLFSDLVPAHIGERYGWAAAFEGFDPARVVSGGPSRSRHTRPA